MLAEVHKEILTDKQTTYCLSHKDLPGVTYSHMTKRVGGYHNAFLSGAVMRAVPVSCHGALIHSFVTAYVARTCRHLPVTS
jgi:hypothetical protein